MTGTISISMGSNSDGAWRRAARVALLLIAGLTASAAPRSPFSAPPPAAAAPGAAMRSEQDPSGDPAPEPDDTDDTDDNAEPFPVFEDEPKPAPVDSGSVNTPVPATGARPDSASFLPVGGESAEPETLRYVPPGERPTGTHGTGPGDEPPPLVKKPRGGPFGLPPILVILGLGVVHVFVVKLVVD